MKALKATLDFSADLNVREGQKVVVGKTAFGGRPGDALVLVLTMKALPE